MSARSELIAAIKDWIIAVAGVPNSKIIRMGAKGSRPALPYISIKITSLGGGGEFGRAESHNSTSGTGAPTVQMIERRIATVSIQSYGKGGEEWLESLQSLIDSPLSLSQQTATNLSLQPLSPMRDLSQLLDTREEIRFILELGAAYRWGSAIQEQVELLTTETNATFTSGSDTFSQTIKTP